MHLHLNICHQGLLSGFQTYGIYKSYPNIMTINIKVIHILYSRTMYFTINSWDILQ
ncbi:hypothetical protein AAKU52_000491 [Pedobacter sp. CG_S7]